MNVTDLFGSEKNTKYRKYRVERIQNRFCSDIREFVQTQHMEDLVFAYY